MASPNEGAKSIIDNQTSLENNEAQELHEQPYPTTSSSAQNPEQPGLSASSPSAVDSSKSENSVSVPEGTLSSFTEKKGKY